MAKEFTNGFYKSKEWIKCREYYISTTDGFCERCKKKNRYEPGKIVHHIIEITPENIHDPNITLNIDNLEYVCQDCHNKEHHGKEEAVTREGLAFDDQGNLIQIPRPPH